MNAQPHIQVFDYRGIAFRYPPATRDERKERDLKAYFDKWYQTIGLQYLKSPGPLNWKKIMQLQRESREDLSRDIMEITHVLLAVGNLSMFRGDTWEVIDNTGISLNPRFNSNIYFFRRQVDAESFAAAEYLGSEILWQIIHVDKVISKRDLEHAEKAAL